jgi:hypothetical protein
LVSVVGSTLGLGCRLDVQLLGQRATACLVLGQCCAPLTIQRQQAHQLPVGFFSPGFELHLSVGVRPCLCIVSAPFVVVGQVIECFHHLAIKPFSLQRGPFLEGAAIAERELLQQTAAAQFSHLCHSLDTWHTVAQTAVAVLLARGAQPGEGSDVEPVVAIGVELDRLAANQKEWLLVVFLIAEGLAQVGERLAEIVTGPALGLIRPKQASQDIPAMGVACLDGQVGQQCPHFVGSKVSHRHVIQTDAERTEQGE